MYIILLSGGSGRRLWPLSNDLCSKQYIKVIESDIKVVGETHEKCSMLQRVFGQLGHLGLAQNTIIAASSSQVEIIQSQLHADVDIAIEPERRDTFPAIMLACSYLRSMKGASSDDFVTILPVDPYTDITFFELINELQKSLEQTNKEIGLIGAKPTYPSEKYGYIIPKVKNHDKLDHFDVDGFVEKPDVEKAEELIDKGALWNCGVFCFKLGLLESYASKYDASLDYHCMVKMYGNLPKISFDYEVLEKNKNIVALTYDGMWKDLGTWNTLTEEMSDNIMGNAVIDEQSENCNVINLLDIPMVVMGAKNMVIAASHDGILVADKHESSYLKKCLDQIQLESKFEERRWGTIKTIDNSEIDGIKSITNRVKMLKNMNTTYHMHMLHDEYITILSGKGVLVREGKEVILKSGDNIHIRAKELHAIKAIEEMRYIEILMGSVVIEDIERNTYEWENIQRL